MSDPTSEIPALISFQVENQENMVIKIHQACSTKIALFYNERKVERHFASFYHSGNMPVANPFLGDKNDRYRVFREIEERNTRVKKKGLHISVNPTVSDLVRLGNAGIQTEIDKLMKHLGYGNQPYLVYKHADLERVHFHVVSTRIDCETGKKIKDSYEKEKTQRFIKGLEEKYQLTKDESRQSMNFRFSGSSKNLKQNLQNLFTQLNQMEFITSKERYDQVLGLFQVEIKRAGRGHLVFVTDDQGNPIRHPVKISDFKERPMFYQAVRLKENLQDNDLQKRVYSDVGKGSRSLKSLVVKELMLQLAKHQSVQKDRKFGNRRKPKRQRGRRF